ncbi:MAG: multicomponent Na+:H+ antiporter subunit [Clostridia bacterium]|nr:multicomponent Na+:H+ antiporter subunit [Clostridia bacterium]
MLTAVAGYINFWLIAILLLVGVYGIIATENLLKKLMALNVISVAIILFYLNLGQKAGSTVPILLPGAEVGVVNAYANPLPHTLMLTAIVVGVATTGVGLAMLYKIYHRYGSLEEPDVLKEMRQ